MISINGLFNISLESRKLYCIEYFLKFSIIFLVTAHNSLHFYILCNLIHHTLNDLLDVINLYFLRNTSPLFDALLME